MVVGSFLMMWLLEAVWLLSCSVYIWTDKRQTALPTATQSTLTSTTAATNKVFSQRPTSTTATTTIKNKKKEHKNDKNTRIKRAQEWQEHKNEKNARIKRIQK